MKMSALLSDVFREIVEAHPRGEGKIELETFMLKLIPAVVERELPYSPDLIDSIKFATKSFYIDDTVRDTRSRLILATYLNSLPTLDVPPRP